MRKFALLLLLVITASVGGFAQTRSTAIGSWYDDLGSPTYGDATLTIEQEGDKHFINRKNGDGSGGRYRVAKVGNAYTKVGDKFGAKYIITPKGLEIHDKKGYIRTAKKKSP